MADKQNDRQTRTGKNRCEAVLRQKRALELRLQGKGYQAIADDIGYSSPGNAYRAVQSALKATIQEPADEVRRVELERLDKLLENQWNWAVNHNQPQAVDRVLRIMERRAKYLGLDAPQQIEIADLRRKAEEIAVRLGISAVDVLGQAEAVAAAAMVGEDY
jgi:gamma-glutamyl:cysteine ligase YbdK (ATP-grasp superfamily)